MRRSLPDRRAAFRSAVAAAAMLVASAASANPNGVAGYTGKPNATAPQGESCNKCHAGGAAPQVTIDGPATLASGQTAEYTLVVRTGQTRAGAGIAASDGASLTAVSALRDSFGELVQSSPRAVAGGSATFGFRVTAPATGGTMRLWAVGLASNGSGTGGDRAAHATREVSVQGPPASASPDGGASGDGGGAGPGPASGASGGVNGGGASGGGANVGGDDDDPDDDAEPAAGAGRPRGLSADQGSCTSAGHAGHTRETSTYGGIFVHGVAALAVLTFARRARSARARSRREAREDRRGPDDADDE
jgi:hypothetical protein